MLESPGIFSRHGGGLPARARGQNDRSAAHTGAPAVASVGAEQLCNRCHGGNALNTGGSVQILDAPAIYAPGTTYTLRVRVTSTQTASSSGRVWGFQLIAVHQNDGTGGDWVYTASTASLDPRTPVRAHSWGGIKIRPR